LSEEVNRKLPARNTTVQLLTIYADPERHNTQRYRRTDRRHYDTKSRSFCMHIYG